MSKHYLHRPADGVADIHGDRHEKQHRRFDGIFTCFQMPRRIEREGEDQQANGSPNSNCKVVWNASDFPPCDDVDGIAVRCIEPFRCALECLAKHRVAANLIVLTIAGEFDLLLHTHFMLTTPEGIHESGLSD